jgi:Family of unknown function (DUF6412)
MDPRALTELVQLGGSLSGLGHVIVSPRDLLAVAVLALVGLAVALLAHGASTPATAQPLTSRAVALQKKAWSAGYQRQLDPGAAGRARPRAPSAAPAAV